MVSHPERGKTPSCRTGCTVIRGRTRLSVRRSVVAVEDNPVTPAELLLLSGGAVRFLSYGVFCRGYYDIR